MCIIIPHAGAINQYIDVKFEQLEADSTRVVCTFLNEPESPSEKSCMIVYRPCEQQNMTFQVAGIRNSSNTIVIDLPVNLELSNYCYMVRSSNGSFTVQVEGQSGETELLYIYPDMLGTASIDCHTFHVSIHTSL